MIGQWMTNVFCAVVFNGPAVARKETLFCKACLHVKRIWIGVGEPSCMARTDAQKFREGRLGNVP